MAPHARFGGFVENWHSIAVMDLDDDAILLAAVPPAPRECTPRARDLVFRYRGGQAIAWWIGLALLGFGAIFGAAFGWSVPLDALLDVASKPVDAVVTSADLDRSVSINDEHPTYLQYVYRWDDQDHVGRGYSMDSAVLARATPDATVTVVVSPFLPSVSRIEGTTVGPFGYFGLFPLVLSGGAGLAAMLLAWRSNRREIRAFIHGQAILGRVVYAGVDQSTKVNGRHPYKVDWDFTIDGRTYRGRLVSMDPAPLESYFGGGKVPVLYVADDPSANTLYVA